MSAGPGIRVVAWNIRAGGGQRVEGIAEQIVCWEPDIVTLSEFRGTAPSRRLAELLGEFGWPHQRATAAQRPGAALRENALLVASRWPLRRLRLRSEPATKIDARRWLLVGVAAPRERGAALAIGAFHAPNDATGRKRRFLSRMLAAARAWRGTPALFAGDSNTGRPVIDEQSSVFGPWHARWMEAMHSTWPDAHRLRHGDAARAYTWCSPNGGNGFRLDEAFLHPALTRGRIELRHEWGRLRGSERRDVLSDHAALLVDFRQR